MVGSGAGDASLVPPNDTGPQSGAQNDTGPQSGPGTMPLARA